MLVPKYAYVGGRKVRYDYSPKWFALGGPPMEPIHYAIHAYQAIQNFLHSQQVPTRSLDSVATEVRLRNGYASSKTRYRRAKHFRKYQRYSSSYPNRRRYGKSKFVYYSGISSSRFKGY